VSARRALTKCTHLPRATLPAAGHKVSREHPKGALNNMRSNMVFFLRGVGQLGFWATQSAHRNSSQGSNPGKVLKVPIFGLGRENRHFWVFPRRQKLIEARNQNLMLRILTSAFELLERSVPHAIMIQAASLTSVQPLLPCIRRERGPRNADEKPRERCILTDFTAYQPTAQTATVV